MRSRVFCFQGETNAMDDLDELENSRFRKGSGTKDSEIGEIKKKVAFRGNFILF